MSMIRVLLDALASGRDHAVPVFEGPASRSHRRRDIRHLSLSATRAAARGGAWGRADTLVLFAGFPRSGHSLVGAIVDSHPRAVVSHELDALGLFEAGMSSWRIAALIRLYASAFRDDGRYWNGHSYTVPNALPEEPARVLGDKKGDWLVRRCSADPALLPSLRRALGRRRLAIVNVVRNPFDNVATMSLRHGRHYDALRIEARAEGAATDAAAILARDIKGTIPRSVLPEMVADYESLCRGLDTIRDAVAAEDWFTLRHETLITDPEASLADLFRFLRLNPIDVPARLGAALVASRDHATRFTLDWPGHTLDRIQALTRRHDFLDGYRFDAPPAFRMTGCIERLDTVSAIGGLHVVTVVGVENDLPLLPHFLEHYIRLGVAPSRIHIIVQSAVPDDPHVETAKDLLDKRGCATPDVWIGAYSSREMWMRRRAVQMARVGTNDWVISADVDELHIYPDGVAPILAELNAMNADWLQGPMIDRLTEDGKLAEVLPKPNLFAQFPLEGELMCAIGRPAERDDAGGTVKVMICAGPVLPGLGGHDVDLEATAEHAKTFVEENFADRSEQTSSRLQRCMEQRAVSALGAPLARHPRIKDAAFRLSFPVYVAHFKWHSGLSRALRRRVSSGLQTSQAETYSRTLLKLLDGEAGSRIDPTFMTRQKDWYRARGWRAHLHAVRRDMTKRGKVLTTSGPAPGEAAKAANGWRLRQLTFGSAGAVGHFHSYYDLPVMDGSAKRIAAVRINVPHRPPKADDRVDIGLVDIDRGGFRPMAETFAWSWQQGPMLQWLPGGDRIVWNDRCDGLFRACIASPAGDQSRWLDRPIYAIAPDGRTALSLNFARLDTMRPGYGYSGCSDGRVEEAAPDDDGIWKVNVSAGSSELILSLARALDIFRTAMTRDERAEHNSADFRYWFNHPKIAQDSGRFTVKLRWRRLDGPWTGRMGVSLTCGMDGSSPRLIARAASHVMWHDPRHLYFWNQGTERLVRIKDVAGAEQDVLMPEAFDANVHLRHIPGAPDRMIYDTPYRETVELREVVLSTGIVTQIATFPGHRPAHGSYRCDLHPVPTADGNRIVVSSLNDGNRQIYVLDRMVGG